MGGIISRKKKNSPVAAAALAIDTDDESSVAKDKNSSPSKKSSSKTKRENDADLSPAAKKAKDKLDKATKKLKTVNQVFTNKSSAKGREANKKFQRKIYLKERAAKLRGRLKDRPTDQRALQEYGEILYEQEDYLTAPKVIKRILASGDTAGDWYLKLGKCYFRRWARSGKTKGEYDKGMIVTVLCCTAS